MGVVVYDEGDVLFVGVCGGDSFWDGEDCVVGWMGEGGCYGYVDFDKVCL